MSCHFHREREATTTCCSCGKLVCDECAIEIDGRVYCKSCVVGLVKEKNNTQHRSTFGAAPGSAYTDRRPASSYSGDARRYTAPRHYSGLLTFFCSVLPGAGQMYLGLIKRGIFFLATFFLSIYLLTVVDSSVIATFILIASVVASFFDAFRIRRLLNAEVYVEDEFDDILSFIKKYALVVFGLLALEFVITYFRRAFGFYYGFESLFGLLILCFGFFLLMIAFGKKKRSGRNHNPQDQDDFIDRR